MKNIFLILLFLTQYCFSQTNYNWKSIEKAEIYTNSKSADCSSIIKPDQKNKLDVDSAALLSHLKTIENYNLDVLLESSCYIIKAMQKGKVQYFVFYPDQGVVYAPGPNEQYYVIKDKVAFVKFIKGK